MCFEHLLDRELQREVFTGFAFDELVRIFKETGQHKRLIAMCERVNAIQADDIGLLGELGDAYLRGGDVVKAIEVFKKMTEKEPDDAVFFCHLGQAFIAAGQFEHAEEAYDKAAEIEPSGTSLFFIKMAHAYVEYSQYEKAEKAIRRCLSLSPDESLYYLYLGDILIARGLLEEAETAYKTAVRLAPSAAGAYYNRLGNALTKAGHLHAAIEAFQEAICADSANPFYYLRLAEICSSVGLSDEATEAHKKAEAMKKR
jgi:predicted Zn-dependent protease